MVRQSIILIFLSALLGLLGNTISPNWIPYIGAYRDLSGGDGPIVPPVAEPGDPPFIDINTAQMVHSTSNVLFIDAREYEEFECGTIPGSVNIPFDYLPEDDLDVYFDSVLAGVPSDCHLITFCSGEECDLSLYLGRLLQDHGYGHVTIFFGGSREWEKFGFEVERRRQCES